MLEILLVGGGGGGKTGVTIPIKASVGYYEFVYISNLSRTCGQVYIATLTSDSSATHIPVTPLTQPRNAFAPPE